MLERGGFSFVALLVINPLVILLYQNCSFLPVTQSELAAKEVMPQKRVISSVTNPQKVDINKIKVVNKPNVASCDSTHQVCPISE
jgi:hypothetical protein